MATENTTSRFRARPRRPKNPADDGAWAFVVLPREASARLPRRGRITVSVAMDGTRFQAMLEPDGQKSHWLRIDEDVLDTSGVAIGSEARFDISAVGQEPDPQVPEDLARALQNSPASLETWNGTTNIARVDWIHWITSAKQAKTREKRIRDACDMLASGKKRVCCFDPSGFYSKAFSAPVPEDDLTGAGSKTAT